MADRHSPIGVFDSGVGGISVLGCMIRRLPKEDFIYYGDMANAPYGTKPEGEVLACVRRVMDRLLQQDVKAVVIACNTATSVAAAVLRQELTLPIIGMEPALKPAAQLRRGGRILVLATPNTLRLPKFELLYSRWGRGAERVPCPGLMELVEREDDEAAERYLRDKLQAFGTAGLDAVVLGCTHYVFLRPILQRLLPPGVHILDGNLGTAQQLRRVLAERDLLNDQEAGHVELQTSADPATALPEMLRLLEKSRYGD